MRNLLSEGAIIDCRIGKTDAHHDQQHPDQCLFIQFASEYETYLKTVLGPELRFYPEINNFHIKLKRHEHGYLLSQRTIRESLFFSTTITCASWPDISLITPAFTLSPSRAQVRADEIYMVLPGPSFRRPPRHYDRALGCTHIGKPPSHGRADPALYERVQAMLAPGSE